jgi:acetyl/propionyl-CoA carboxylase alpha subunit
MILKAQNDTIKFEIENNQLILDDSSDDFKIVSESENQCEIEIDGQIFKAHYYKHKDNIYVNVDGRNYVYKEIEEDDLFTGAASNQDKAEIQPPMPGSVVKVLVTENQEVSEGEGLIVVEAMKMETTLYSPISGIVKEINAKEKDQLSGEEILMVVEK